jgi:membrane protein
MRWLAFIGVGALRLAKRPTAVGRPPNGSIVDLLRQLRILKFRQCWNLIEESFSEWVNDKVPRLGAALAFYTALSVAPLLVVVLATAGLFYGRAAIQGEIVWQIQDLVGPEGAKVIQALISSAAHRPTSGIIATILGLVALLFGASSAFAELQDALNTIWQVPFESRQSKIAGLFGIVKRRVLSFVLVLSIGFLLLVSLFVGAWITAAETFVGSLLPLPGPVLHIINLLLSFVVITFLFAVVYKVLPDVRLKWSDVAIGASITSLLFSIGKLPIGLYLGKTTIESSYGAAGSFLILLLWVYYSAQVFFLGAEFTKIYTQRFGSQFRAKLELQPERLERQAIVDLAPTEGH